MRQLLSGTMLLGACVAAVILGLGGLAVAGYPFAATVVGFAFGTGLGLVRGYVARPPRPPRGHRHRHPSTPAQHRA